MANISGPGCHDFEYLGIEGDHEFVKGALEFAYSKEIMESPSVHIAGI